MDLDVACLAGKATALAAGNQRPMDQDLRIRQGENAYPWCRWPAKMHPWKRTHAHADGGNIALDILHGIVDGHIVGNGTARAADVEAISFFGSCPSRYNNKCNDHVAELLTSARRTR